MDPVQQYDQEVDRADQFRPSKQQTFSDGRVPKCWTSSLTNRAKMKQIVVILFGCLGLLVCKGHVEKTKDRSFGEVALKSGSVPKTPVQVFRVVYDSAHMNTSGQLALLNKSLTGLFKESEDVKDKE